VQISTSNLRRLREDRGLRLSDLAKAAGLSPSYLSELESGKRQPSPVVVSALATTLGVTTGTLRRALVCPNCGYELTD
jgi:transcriptional regulator with XRE-family HTH domain